MKLRLAVASCLAAGLFLAGGVGASRAEDGGGGVLKSLERKIESLERRQESLEKEWKSSPRAEDGKGRDGTPGLSLKVAGYFQGDGRSYFDGGTASSPPPDTFLVRAAVFGVEGAVGKNCSFRLQGDFGDGRTALLDAWAEVRPVPSVGVRFGKGKVPIGQERLLATPDLRFLETGLATALTPNRDVGAQLLGDAAGGRVAFAAGIFDGLPDGTSGDGESDRGKDFAGRIVVTPFQGSGKGAVENLGLGFGGSYGRTEGSVDTAKKSIVQNLPSYKSAGQQAFFSYRSDTTGYSKDNTAIADGVRARIAPQAYWYWGPVGISGEYVRSRQEVRRDRLSGSVRDTLTHSAWQASASWVVTGEKASGKRVVPARPFDPSAGGWGAVEVAARVGDLRIDKGAFPVFADPAKSASRARNTGASVNWYLNETLKVVADYEQTSFDGGAAGGKDRQAEKVLSSRLQAAF